MESRFRSLSFVLKILSLLLLVSWYVFFLATPVQLTSSDLGRHIKNGELVVSSISSLNFKQLQAVLHTNFYSYSYPDYSFINHHWGAGVLFYAVWSLAGFNGLSVFYIALSLLTFLIFFYVSVCKAGWKVSVPLAVFLAPLIAERVEIRPEGFSYFFAALFLLLLTRYAQNKISFRKLFLSLVFLEVIWVNFHIYFIFGIAMVAFFGLEQVLVKSEKLKEINKFGMLLFLVVVACIINPSTISGLLFPFFILKDFGIDVAENAPGWLLAKEGFGVYYYQYKIFVSTLILFVVGVLWCCFKAGLRNKMGFIGLTAIFGYLAWGSVRNYTVFALFALPTMAMFAYDIELYISKFKPFTIRIVMGVFLLFFIGSTVFLNQNRVSKHFKRTLGIGVVKKSSDAVKFFKNNNLSGPIFNNFDIGSYLIFSFFPSERIFVDNRPEAYPSSFFKDVFIPMHASPDIWEQQEKKFHFNAIIFSLDSRAPWTLPFIVARINDPQWAPVFANESVIIFLKRNELNSSVISNFEIDKKRFKCPTCPYLLI